MIIVLVRSFHLPFVYMPTSTIATNKTYGLDGGVITDSVNGGNSSVHHIDDARRQAYHPTVSTHLIDDVARGCITRAFTEFCDDHGCTGVTL